MVEKETLDFLQKLQKNNNRDWFEKNKPKFQIAKSNFESVMQELQDGLNETDVIEFSKVYRIYRDVRFSKDKTPYKTYFSGFMRRAGEDRRGSYWVSLQPGNSIIGGGFYGPDPKDLFRIRKEFQMDDTINKIISAPDFKKYFGKLQGEAVKTAPKGFAKDVSNIELIRMKQFYAFRTFSDKEVLSKNYLRQAQITFQALRPYFDYMSQVLTTNLDGESV